MRYATILILSMNFLAAVPAGASPNLEQDLSQIFVGRSFTIRNFYRGGHLRYGSDGELVGKAEPGFWSRDGMVQFSSIRLSRDGVLVMQGNRFCVQFEPEYGEFVNVRIGDKLEIEIQVRPDQLSKEALIPLLQKVLLSSRDRLADLVPSYWANCLSRKVVRSDKRLLWECEATDKAAVPDLFGKNPVWDLPARDNSLHNNTRHYLLKHRVAYLTEQGTQSPMLQESPDPFLDWLQARTNLKAMTLVLAITVGVDGRAHDIVIVTRLEWVLMTKLLRH